MRGRSLDDHLEEYLRRELDLLVPTWSPEGEWSQVLERASSGIPAVSPGAVDGGRGEADTSSAGASLRAAKTSPTEGRLVSRDGRRRSAFAWAAISLAVLVLLAGLGTGIFEAVTHLSKDQPILVITDDTLSPATTGETTETTTQTTATGAATTAPSGHWEQLPLTMTSNGGAVSSLVMDPGDPSVLYMGMSEGLFKSSDGAVSWDPLPVSTGGNTYLMAVDPASASTVYVLAWDGSGMDGFAYFSRSEDDGATWTDLSGEVSIDGPPFPAGTLVLPNGLDDPDMMWLDTASSPSTIYISTIHEPTDDTGDKRQKAWRSTDRGENWTELSPEEATQVVEEQQRARPAMDFPGTLTDADTGAVVEVSTGLIDPGDPAIRYGGTDHGVYKSTDGGATWQKASARVNSAVLGAAVLGVVPDPSSPSTLYAVTPEGIVKSEDAGATWDLILGGQGSLALAPSSPSTLYAWTTAGLFRTDDGGVNWTQLPGAGLAGTSSALGDTEHRLVLVAADNPDTVFALMAAPGMPRSLLRSTDGGNTWNQVLEGIMIRGVDPGGEGLLVPDPNNPSTLFAAAGTGDMGEVCQVVKSTDAGATWTVVSPKEWVDYYIRGIAVDRNTPANVYVVQQPAGPDDWPGPVFRSRDGGATWEKFDLRLVGSGEWTPGRLLFDPQSPDTLYVSTFFGIGWGFGAELYRSTDGGATWKRIWEPNDDPAGVDLSTTITIYPAPGGGLYAVTGSGLFKWTLENE